MSEVVYCECEEQKVDEKRKGCLYNYCKSCGGVIGRKEGICIQYMENGYCEYAENNGYTYPCKVDGKFKDCVTGRREMKSD